MKQRAVALAIAQAMEPEKRLQRAKAYIKGVGVISPLNKTAQLAAAGEIASSCDINAIKSMLEKPRWKNHKAHSCLTRSKVSHMLSATGGCCGPACHEHDALSS